MFWLRRFAVALVAAVVAISHATAGESHAAAAAGTWTWAAAAGDNSVLLAVPRSEARPGRLNDAPPPGRLVVAAATVSAAPALIPPPPHRFLIVGHAPCVSPLVFASDRSARGPPGAVVR